MITPSPSTLGEGRGEGRHVIHTLADPLPSPLPTEKGGHSTFLESAPIATVHERPVRRKSRMSPFLPLSPFLPPNCPIATARLLRIDVDAATTARTDPAGSGIVVGMETVSFIPYVAWLSGWIAGRVPVGNVRRAISYVPGGGPCTGSGVPQLTEKVPTIGSSGPPNDNCSPKGNPPRIAGADTPPPLSRGSVT